MSAAQKTMALFGEDTIGPAVRSAYPMGTVAGGDGIASHAFGACSSIGGGCSDDPAALDQYTHSLTEDMGGVPAAQVGGSRRRLRKTRRQLRKTRRQQRGGRRRTSSQRRSQKPFYLKLSVSGGIKLKQRERR